MRRDFFSKWEKIIKGTKLMAKKKPEPKPKPEPEPKWRPHITPREYFAAMALQGLLGNMKHWDEITNDNPVSLAVSYADALIAELAKPVGE